MTLLLLKTFFSSLELFTGLICSFTIFRLPVKYNLMKIAFVSIVNSIIAAYTLSNLPDFAFLINLSCQVILVSLIFRFPFFYALLINFVFYLLGSILEYCVFLIGTRLHVFDSGNATDDFNSSLIFIVTSIISLILAWLLERKKIGFMFIARYFTIRQSVKGYNFALSAVLIAGITILNIVVMIAQKTFSLPVFFLFALALLFLIGIYIAYKENKKQLHEKHERLKNR